MFEKVLVHILSHHHLLVQVDQKLLSLFAAHLVHLHFERGQIELLFQREFAGLIHNHSPSLFRTFGLLTPLGLSGFCRFIPVFSLGTPIGIGFIAPIITEGNKSLTK